MGVWAECKTGLEVLFQVKPLVPARNPTVKFGHRARSLDAVPTDESQRIPIR